MHRHELVAPRPCPLEHRKPLFRQAHYDCALGAPGLLVVHKVLDLDHAEQQGSAEFSPAVTLYSAAARLGVPSASMLRPARMAISSTMAPLRTRAAARPPAGPGTGRSAANVLRKNALKGSPATKCGALPFDAVEVHLLARVFSA